MIKKIILSSGTIVATLALTSGMALASSISNTGKGSVNSIGTNNINLCTGVNNNNSVLNTVTGQQAKSGNAKVTNNTAGGSATSGTVANQNTTGLAVTVANSSACGNFVPTVVGDDSSISATGNKSVNVISSTNVASVTAVNNNNTWVNTVTLQGAQSGDATVSGNTGSGDALSGNVLNTNGTTVILNVTND